MSLPLHAFCLSECRKLHRNCSDMCLTDMKAKALLHESCSTPPGAVQYVDIKRWQGYQAAMMTTVDLHEVNALVPKQHQTPLQPRACVQYACTTWQLGT